MKLNVKGEIYMVNYKMIFNMKQADFLIKNGVPVVGAGKHKVTGNNYILFDGNSPNFSKYMTEWKNK